MRAQSILYGNGLNLLNNGTASWDELLKVIAKERLDNNIPNTLKYEAVVLKEPYREAVKFITADGRQFRTADGKLLFVSGEIVENRLKQDIAERVSEYEPNEIYRMVAELPVNHFITTNYDNTLLKVKGKDNIKARYRKEVTYSIRRNYTLVDANLIQYYWPIHGNVESPRSIMLGFDHYCGALSNVESYVKGNYSAPEYGRIPSMMKRLTGEINHAISWVDLFFISDVHIIGQGLAYEEMDLWWILNKRRRIKQKDAKLIQNHIIYYPDMPLTDDKMQLLKGFEVEISELSDYSGGYLSNYRIQLEKMRERIIMREV